MTLRCGCRDHVAAHGVCLATVCHPTSVTLNLFQGLYKLWLYFYRSRIKFGMTAWMSVLRWEAFFLTQRIRSLSQSKGTCLQRYVGISTTHSDRVGGTSNASCKDKPAPPVTQNSFQGLYKFWLNVLQIPNQVRDDDCMAVLVGVKFFLLTQRIRPLSLSKGACLQIRSGTLAIPANWPPCSRKTKKSSQMCQFLEF